MYKRQQYQQQQQGIYQIFFLRLESYPDTAAIGRERDIKIAPRSSALIARKLSDLPPQFSFLFYSGYLKFNTAPPPPPPPPGASAVKQENDDQHHREKRMKRHSCCCCCCHCCSLDDQNPCCDGRQLTSDRCLIAIAATFSGQLY